MTNVTGGREPSGIARNGECCDTSYVLRIQDHGPVIELRLTVWEMSLLRDAMLETGAAHAAFPPTDTEKLTKRCPSGRRGMPAYKLAEPAGWLVGQDEILEALYILRSASMPEFDLWRRWKQFLIFASRNGGFTVS